MEHMPELTWYPRGAAFTGFRIKGGGATDGRGPRIRGARWGVCLVMRVSCGRRSPASAKQLMALRARSRLEGGV